MMEYVQTVAGFGAIVDTSLTQGEVMLVGEAQKFKRLNLFQWQTMEIDRWVRDNPSTVTG